MPEMKVIKVDARDQHGTALIASDESVWVTVAPPWWDAASWLWWWLCPYDRKAWVILRTDSGHFRSRAIRVAHRHARIRYVPTPGAE